MCLSQTQPPGSLSDQRSAPGLGIDGGSGTGEDTAHPHPSSRGGVGDLLYPAHFLVGSSHVAVDEATQLGPGSLRLWREVFGKFLDHIQNDPREDLGAKGRRGSKRLSTLPVPAPPAPSPLSTWCLAEEIVCDT